VTSEDQGQEETREESGGLSSVASPVLLQTRVALLEPSRVFDAETLATAFERVAQRGWNAVALPGFLDGYPIFSSPVWAQYGLRRQHPDFRKWDPLEVAFDAAWRHGLDVILNLQPYLANANLTGRRRPPLPRKYPRWMARRHPDRKRRFQDESVKRQYCCRPIPSIVVFCAIH
jgi:hypothetical protein